MTDIAHCGRCGHKPNGVDDDDGGGVLDIRCGFGGGKRMHWSDWQALVMADLAAQERELTTRNAAYIPSVGRYGDRDYKLARWETMGADEARRIVTLNYRWRKANPLVLP